MSSNTVVPVTNEVAMARTSQDRVKTLAIAIFLLIAVLAFSHWLYQRMTHIYTDDARITADMIDISSKVSGWIVQFPIASGDTLQQRDTIAVIDSRETQLKLEELEASVLAMTADYEGQQAEIVMVEQQTTGALQAARSQLHVSEAALASASSELEFRASEWQRAQTLRERKILSQHDFESAQTLFRKSQQGRQAALGQVASARAKRVEAHADQSRLKVMERDLEKFRFERQSLRSQLERHRVDLQDRHMVAPQKGVVDKAFVDIGEYVHPGRRLILMHNPDKVWVNANIKETDIRHVKVGQSVVVNVDAYPNEKFSGRVAKIGHAATSQFSLLPSTNPSGNFTKVTQRLTVKIPIDQRDHMLKPGMMVEVEIDIR
jgi:membrane fusion protein, multidrug efflux system